MAAMASVITVQEHHGSDALPLDALGQYMREVHRFAPLGEGEEQRLLAQMRAGHAGARTRMVEACQPWIVSIARRYAGGSVVLSLLDYVQEGNVGLLEAIARHDGRTGPMPFRSWAYWWVRGAMRQAFWRFEGSRCVPEHQARALVCLAAVQGSLLAALGREPTVDELAERLGMAARRLLELLLLQQHHVLSLERWANTSDGEDDGTRAHLFPAPVADNDRDGDDDDGGLVSRVRHLIGHLPARERAIILLRYGFVDGVERTQREVGERLGLPQSTVEEIDRRVRIRLRRALEGASGCPAGAA